MVHRTMLKHILPRSDDPFLTNRSLSTVIAALTQARTMCLASIGGRTRSTVVFTQRPTSYTIRAELVTEGFI